MTDAVYHSLLWKAALLTSESSQFPALVRAAARFHGKPYNDEMLYKVGTDPEIVGALQVNIEETIDLALQRYATNPETAGALDGLILAAVERYQVPASTPSSSSSR